MNSSPIEGFRIALAQQRLLAWQSQGPSPFVTRALVHISGHWERTNLVRALEKIHSRHEILRTSFMQLPGFKVPLQIISQTRTADPIEHHDLTRCSGIEQHEFIETILQQSRLVSFDLEAAPFLRVVLFDLSSSEQALLISISALCADHLTLRNLIHEVASFVNSGNELSAPAQFLDYSEWQHELQDEDKPIHSLAYLPNLELRSEKSLSSEQAWTTESFNLPLSQTVLDQIRDVCERLQTPLKALMLAIWCFLLVRLSDRREIVIGSVSDGRPSPEFADAFGLFSRYVPVVLKAEPKQRLNDFVSVVNAALSAAEEFRDVWFWGLIPDNHVSQADFFSACFDFISAPPKISFGKDILTIEREFSCFDKYKVRFVCRELNCGLSAEFHYDSNLFALRDVQTMAAHLHELLERAVSEPEQPIGRLAFINESRERLLRAANGQNAQSPDELCVHELFELQVIHKPEAIAIECEDQELTYRQLNQRANQLAAYLSHLSVHPDQPVGLCLEQTPEMVVGLLGVLKAGGAYAVLDPTLPAQRLDFMVETAGVKVLLTQDKLRERLSSRNVQVICVDGDWDLISRESDENRRSNVGPANLAYIIYTSGSTGEPKGVGIEHRQLSNYINAIRERIAFPEDARFALISGFAADLGYTMLYGALATGGRLHVVPTRIASDPFLLAECLRQRPSDCLKIVPSHLSMLLSANNARDILPRQRLVMGGEQLSWELIEKIRDACAENCQILNHYGPTETTVGVLTHQPHDESITANSSNVPIGRPLANTRAYVLDSELNPVSHGITGELYIGGGNLARGYVNRPALTAERFLPNPFSDEPGSRLYRTGDIVRRLTDGTIEFFGRQDNQVKIRGFRVELEEIETALKVHPHIEQAKVIVRSDEVEGNRIFAYLVVSDPAPSVNELRRYLRTHLPDYMIPAAFIPMTALPLTIHGKVDHAALPEPSEKHLGGKQPFVAPRTAMEELLAGVWAEVFRMNRVGINDNFFALGGNSLLVIAVIARAGTRNINLTFADLFHHPTIAELATVVRSQLPKNP